MANNHGNNKRNSYRWFACNRAVYIYTRNSLFCAQLCPCDIIKDDDSFLPFTQRFYL